MKQQHRFVFCPSYFTTISPKTGSHATSFEAFDEYQKKTGANVSER